MEKREWIQALLDGKTMTSDEANGKPICFNANGEFEYGEFEYIDSSRERNQANPNMHGTNLREYFEYPMWFECISKHCDNGMIVKFDSITRGILVKEANDGCHKIGKGLVHWVEHTNTHVWKQVTEPAIKEMTLEEVCKLIGKEIKIIK